MTQPDVTMPREIVATLFSAQISQSGTAVPTLEVLWNPKNLVITWERTTAGTYVGTITNYTAPTDITVASTIFIQTQTPDTLIYASVSNNNQISIQTRTLTGGYADDCLSVNSLELKIFTNKII